jgi:hypothetical protein
MISFGQAPKAFKYQAIARDNTGTPIVNQNIGLRISLLQGDREGPVAYSETQNLPTNSYGLINLDIGKGRVLSGIFSDINWERGPYYLKMEMDITGGMNYQFTGTSELLSVPYALYAEHSGDEGNRAGEWTNNGTNIYVAPAYAANNVGIGTTNPAQKLHIYSGTGVANFQIEGTYAGGGTAGISNFYLKNNSGGTMFGFFFKKESGITYMAQSAYDGSSWIAYNKLNYSTKELEYKEGLVDVKFSNTGNILMNNTGNVGIGTTTPSVKLHVSGGQVRVDNTIAWLYLNSTSSNAGYDFEENGTRAGGICYMSGGDYIKMASSTSGTLPYDLVLARSGNVGIGTNAPQQKFTVQGNSYFNGNVGIGTSTPASRLEVYYSFNNFSRLGNNDIIGNYLYHSEVSADGDGQSALYAYRGGSNDGTGYAKGTTNQAIQSFSLWGDEYSFGMAGFNWNDYTRCGGILGAEIDGTYWGALGYKTSGSTGYGGYFSSHTSGSGKGSNQANIGIGIGAWGDLMAADFHGKVYGIYTEGENYAMFSHGAVYKDNVDVHLQKNREGNNRVLYTNVSTDVTVQTSGTATLSDGMASISFDLVFADIVSSEEPVVVTVTPMGESNGVYLSNVTSTGFTVVENNAGKSNVTINYIAIGKRAGYENPQLAKEVVETGYTSKLARGLHADSDTKTNGEGLYYENGELVIGVHPSSLPDPNKPKVDPNAPPLNVPIGNDKNGTGYGRSPETDNPTGNPLGADNADVNKPDVSKLK